MAKRKSNLPDPKLLRKHAIELALATAGLNQSDIARALKVSPQVVSAVIAGNTRSKRIQKYLCRRLGMPYVAWWGEATRAVRVA